MPTFSEQLAEAEKQIETEVGGRASRPAGRPLGDAYSGEKINLYLRKDVTAWLRLEAARRGQGVSTGRIVTELVRAAMVKGTTSE